VIFQCLAKFVMMASAPVVL